jgi:hypothetical protein
VDEGSGSVAGNTPADIDKAMALKVILYKLRQMDPIDREATSAPLCRADHARGTWAR